MHAVWEVVRVGLIMTGIVLVLLAIAFVVVELRDGD